MKRTPDHEFVRRLAPILLAGAMFTLAGGYVHLREWLDTYRNLPTAVPGSFVVREGFIVNAVASLVIAAALVVVALKPFRRSLLVVVGALGFQVSSLIVLIASRTGSVFGWSEQVWNRGADQARAVEIGAIAVLTLVLAIGALRRVSGAAATTTQPVLQ